MSKIDVINTDLPVRDQRKQDFLKYYWTPAETETFGNVYQAALKAGYSESYARLMASPSVGNKWIREYQNGSDLSAEHILSAIESIAVRSWKDSDKLRALELLAKLKGMLVEKKVVGHISIEKALEDLK